jgi:hypothetical protein
MRRSTFVPLTETRTRLLCRAWFPGLLPDLEYVLIIKVSGRFTNNYQTRLRWITCDVALVDCPQFELG